MMDQCLEQKRRQNFFTKLEGLVPGPKVNEVNSDEVIHDGHAVIWCLLFHSSNTTFGEKAKQFITSLRNHLKNGSETHVVFDRYHYDSTEGGTMEERGNFSNTYIVSADKHIPQNYTSFLESSENKTSLASFSTQYMQENIQPIVDKNEKIYVSGSNGDNTMKITRGSVTSDPELKSNMEEVDGRIIFHAITAAYSGAKTITVRSRDTDVAVLLIQHFQQIGCEQLFMYCGKNEKVWYVPIHAIYSALSSLKNILYFQCIAFLAVTLLVVFMELGKQRHSSVQERGRKCPGIGSSWEDLDINRRTG